MLVSKEGKFEAVKREMKIAEFGLAGGRRPAKRPSRDGGSGKTAERT